MSQSRHAPGAPVLAPRWRISIQDVIAALILLGWTAAGIVATAHDVSVYRAQQEAAADFAARHQWEADQTPYQPELPVRLGGEVAASLVGLVLLTAGLRFWRRNSVRVSVKLVSAPRPRAAPAETRVTRSETFRGAKPAAVAAERLSAIVWTDQLARREQKRA